MPSGVRPFGVIVFSALVLAIFAWDIFLAGQMAQLRGTPPFLAALCGFAALLLAPAILVNIADAGGIGLVGRTLSGVAWVWPLTVACFTLQALYVTFRRLVSPALGFPIIAFNAALLILAVTRYVVSSGVTPPLWTTTLGAAYVTALTPIVGPAALASPYLVVVPMVAPAFPARWPASRAVRATMAVIAAASVILVGATYPYASRVTRSYNRYAEARFQQRPAGDFAVGVRLLPPLTSLPPQAALRNDLELVDTTGAEAVSVVINPEAARGAALDSLAHTLDSLRRDSTLVMVALGYPHDARSQFDRDPVAYDAARLADVDRIVHHIDPDYLLPADEPTAAGDRALHGRSPASWEQYFIQAAALVHRYDRRIKVGIAVGTVTSADSTLYVWSVSPASPLDVVGFSVAPGTGGANALDVRLHTAGRWLVRDPEPVREHWIFAIRGYPTAHGELSQARAVWGTIAWATAHPVVKGVMVADASDYGALTGLRAADGRLRPVVEALARATQAIRDSAE